MDVDVVQGVIIMLMGFVVAFQGICLWAVAKRLKMHIQQRHHDGRN